MNDEEFMEWWDGCAWHKTGKELDAWPREKLAQLAAAREQFVVLSAAEEKYNSVVAALQAELEMWREGGLTEDVLRRNDGYIKVGKGCAIVLADEVPNEHQGSGRRKHNPKAAGVGEILNTMEELREDGWIIVLKVLPREMAFLIEGSRSEYDAPCPDKHVGKGKWCVEASDGWYLSGKKGHRMRGGGFVMADTAIEAIRKCYFRIQAQKHE